MQRYDKIIDTDYMGSNFELLDVEEYCDLEILVRGPSSSLEMAAFDRSFTSSYLPSIHCIYIPIVSFPK